jgi:phosphate transport system substrate-binding protein
MNDNFLYELRSPPPAGFAARLKARLDLQASEARQKRRAFKWFVFGAILMGGTALAFVSPSLRQATVAMIMRFRGTATPETLVARTPIPALASGDVSDSAWGVAASATSGIDVTSRAPQNFAEENEAAPATERSSAATTAMIPGAARPRPNSTLHIAYFKGVAPLVEALGEELEERFLKVNVVASGLPSSVDLCTRSFQGVATDIVLSDQRLTESGTIVCDGRERYVEVAFAYDAVVLIVNRGNTWTRSITLPELRKFREDETASVLPTPSTPLAMWSQVRAHWPTVPIVLVGTPLQESELGMRFATALGLFRSPTTLEVAKDDRATMRSVENALGAVGYIDFGSLSAVLNERPGLSVVAVVNEKGEAIEPSVASIQEHRYELSRPIWLYVATNRLVGGEIGSVFHYLFDAKAIEQSGLVSLGKSERHAAIQRLMQVRTGTTRN